MHHLKSFLVTLLVVSVASTSAVNNDSYLQALKHTKGIDTVADLRTSRGDFQPSYYPTDTSPTEFDSFGQQQPRPVYGPPGYEPSKPSVYGPPGYEPPKPSVYGPPAYEAKPIYAAAPTIHQVYYGHSAPYSPTTAAGWSAPRDDHWLLNKLKLKMDFFTIGKILLKLLIFKKIVKFIALICLLLFLPKLQAISSSTPDKDDEEALEERRQFDVKCKLNCVDFYLNSFLTASTRPYHRQFKWTNK